LSLGSIGRRRLSGLSKKEQQISSGGGVVDHRLDGNQFPALSLMDIKLGLNIFGNHLWEASSRPYFYDFVLCHGICLLYANDLVPKTIEWFLV
jgi:hypothetical protein